ncbi:YdcF family protein [Acetobacter farinalis]|uniref:YdcF family protein n=1 Tax=Acetobacter farinalis TaxID=1260984 RepID=A0ABT3Q4I5_9PROT|nr:YdcF family protein [Acetobacter farinalis]MCX2560197.1 YdcF family protein [Acetobacter farinalis]
MMREAARPYRPSRLHRFVVWWFKVGLLVSLALCGAFGWFVYDALRPAPAITPHTDGIVALTGGQGRVDMSLRLLMQNRGDKLLISGVDPQASQQDLLPPRLPDTLKDRVTLGYLARSTIENASETAAWVADNHIHTLTVVTAGYHMRRALVELRRTLPGVTLYAYPVIPPALEHPFHKPTLRLLLREFAKWLGALAGFVRNPSHSAG